MCGAHHVPAFWQLNTDDQMTELRLYIAGTIERELHTLLNYRKYLAFNGVSITDGTTTDEQKQPCAASAADLNTGAQSNPGTAL